MPLYVLTQKFNKTFPKTKIIAHSTLPAFATDYTEQADHLPAINKG